MFTSARMQLLAWFLQVQTPGRSGGCGSETLERTMPWRKEREQHHRGLGQQLLSLPLCIHPYQRHHLNPKTMYQKADPYL